MVILPFDSSNESHARFVFDAVRKRAYDWPYTPSDGAWLAEIARKTTVANPRGCVLGVDPSDPDLFYGYVLVEGPQLVTFAFTKLPLRGPGEFGAPKGTPAKHAPVCSSLLASVGVDVSAPCGVRIWSRNSSKIAERGYPLYPVPVE